MLPVKKIARTLSLLTIGLVLGACGDSADDVYVTGGNGRAGIASMVQSGVFVDSAVAGIKYRTTTLSRQGVTDAKGSFDYVPGEIVIFSIGGIDLPPVPAKGYLQPQDIFTSQDGVTNLARLLQSLDSDDDPTNGITLDPAVHTAFASITEADVGFTNSPGTFGASAAVTSMVSRYGGADNTLVSATTARAHLASSTLVGSWYTAPLETYSFTRDGHYMHVVSDGGIEYGTYVWDPVTGKLTGSQVYDSNGAAGLSSGGVVATPSAARLTLGGRSFLPASSTASPLMGGWARRDEGDGYTQYLVFTPEHGFTMASYTDPEMLANELAKLPSESRSRIGAQVGAYTWNSLTGALGLSLGVTGRPTLDEVEPDELVQTIWVHGDMLAPNGQGPGDEDGDILRIW